MKTTLNKMQEKQVLKDFVTWSGGWLPHEVAWFKKDATEWAGVACMTYVRYGAPANLPRAAVRAYLLKLHKDEQPSVAVVEDKPKLARVDRRTQLSNGMGPVAQELEILINRHGLYDVIEDTALIVHAIAENARKHNRAHAARLRAIAQSLQKVNKKVEELT